jgi:hypothetical protein
MNTNKPDIEELRKTILMLRIKEVQQEELIAKAFEVAHDIHSRYVELSDTLLKLLENSEKTK